MELLEFLIRIIADFSLVSTHPLHRVVVEHHNPAILCDLNIQLADNIGINMHTVNKAYSVLRQEGLLSIDRRKGAVISIDADKLYAMQELREDLQVILAKAVCKNISKEEVHQLVDEIYSNYADET